MHCLSARLPVSAVARAVQHAATTDDVEIVVMPALLFDKEGDYRERLAV